MAAVVAGAVTAQAQTTFGVHAAALMASQSVKYGNTDFDTKGHFGWKIGGVANMPVASNIAFMPQLNVLNKGSEFEFTESGVKVEGTTSLTYVELPLNFVYTSGGFFGGIGPSIAFGIGGKDTYKAAGFDEQEADVKFDGKKDATDDKSHYKGLDFGAQVIAGYKLPSGLFLNVHYNLGFSNISPEDDAEIKNSYFGVGVGFMFGGSGQAKK